MVTGRSPKANSLKGIEEYWHAKRSPPSPCLGQLPNIKESGWNVNVLANALTLHKTIMHFRKGVVGKIFTGKFGETKRITSEIYYMKNINER